ncbi:COP9 signalosome complex subunit 3 [Brachionus plicatilis]|uniref:COP9 signalosome complex subunit 3 n=1 Tax=Brachionus plicatilis TaxID=10195 RepID=A0A3M7SI65_BRAPC|nr:COP9 signalosome complex subunit 3 [Brachionus plicatilis]
MESLVSTVRSFYQTHQAETSKPLNYQEIISNFNANTTFQNETADNLLNNLVPLFPVPEFTLATITILNNIIGKVQSKVRNLNEIEAVSNLTGINEQKLMSELENCLKNSDHKQIEYSGDMFADLCHFYTNKLIHLNQAKKGLLTINESIRKLQYDSHNAKFNTNQMTTVHSDLLKLSLSSKNFTLALKLMSNEILDIKKTSCSTFDAKYYLSYFYYCGCVSASLKHFEDSLFYFEQVLNVPANALSQIMIDSYKKYVLISLIYKGKVLALPKYTSRKVVNQIKPMCSVYHELASAFIDYELDKLNSLCQKYEEMFERDRNNGLIKQLQNAFYKLNIQKLTKTFITLSLSDIVAKTRLNSTSHAETLILNMIRDGEVFATINQKDGMVSFHDNPEKYDNPSLTNQLTGEIFGCIDMENNIKQMENEISTHPHYIQKCQANAGTGIDEIDQLLQ